MNLLQFLSAVVTLRILVPFSITSWCRTPTHNEAVGGVPNSFHLLGLAVDIILDNPEQVRALSAQAVRMGLEVIIEGDHLHLEPAPTAFH